MELYRYHVDKPDGYSPSSSKTYPLILFLHGWGENGEKQGRSYIQQVKFHGPLEDPKKQVPRRFSKNSKELYKQLGGKKNKNAHLIIYPGEGHSGAWIKAYNNHTLYDWFLGHSKP